MLVIGSGALSIRLAEKGGRFRKPADLDIICTHAQMRAICKSYGQEPERVKQWHWRITAIPKFRQIEFDIAEENNSNAAYLNLSLPDNHLLNVNGFFIPVATLEILYSIKRSHRFIARHWEKNIRDYHLLKGIVKDDAFPDLTKMRQEEHNAHKTPSLQKTKDEFFDDDVSNHVFEHDQMHEVMAHRERPLFTYIQISPERVTTDKNKFFELSLNEQRLCVLEEAYVIALERAIIPMIFEGKKMADSRSAMQWALMRICTTLTGGWFRTFASDNYIELWSMYDREYVNKFLTAVEEGRIKRLERHGHSA